MSSVIHNGKVLDRRTCPTKSLTRSKSLSLGQDKAEEWLAEHAPHIEIKEWGGRFTAKSVFCHKKSGAEFTKTFSNVKSCIARGQDVGIGTGQHDQFMKEEDAKKWLAEYAPHVEMLEWGGKGVSLCKFYNSRVDSVFYRKFSMLKHDIKGKGREVGAGLDNRKRDIDHAQARIDEISDRFQILDYQPGGTKKCLFLDKERNVEFSYYWSSFMSMLNYNKDFSPFLPAQRSSLERVMKDILDDLGQDYLCDRPLSEEVAYRPDFVLPDHSLIIECDGLYWHSEKEKPRNYHQKKKDEYDGAGYKSLFFREDELLDTPEIVRSVVVNALKMNKKRVFARKCRIEEIPSNWFEGRHLMGSGAGKCYGLVHKGEVVAGIQVKWISKDERVLDVSRFCPELETTVVGGLSKLLAFVEKEYDPKIVQTFVDRRYGFGTYLESLGFSHAGTHLSFRWIKRDHSFNRMKFPKNTGYDHGYVKLWDCGQAKWVKEL